MQTKPSEASEAARLKQKFGKGSEQTKVFEDWDESVQSLFLKEGQLEDGELPILGHYQPAGNWFLVTTRRILWLNPDRQLYELRLEDVESVGWSSGPTGWPGRDMASPPDTLVHTEKGLGHCKHYSPWLHVIDTSGKRYEAFLEPGKTLKAMRNVIWQLSGGWYCSYEYAEQARQKHQEIGPPATGSDAYKAARLEKDILKHGNCYSSQFFRSLPPGTQDFFLSEAKLHRDELAVFGFFEDQETWFLATSRSVLWSRPGFKHRLKYGQIKDLGLSEMKELGPAAFEDSEQRKSKIGQIKGTSPRFYLVDDEGRQYEALLPPGATLFAVWNTLMLAIRLDKIHPANN